MNPRLLTLYRSRVKRLGFRPRKREFTPSFYQITCALPGDELSVADTEDKVLDLMKLTIQSDTEDMADDLFVRTPQLLQLRNQLIFEVLKAGVETAGSSVVVEKVFLGVLSWNVVNEVRVAIVQTKAH